MGAAAIALDISRTAHLAFAAVVFSGLVVVAYPYLLKGPDHDNHPSARTGKRGRGAGLAVYATLLALVVIAVAGATVEDAGSSWATLYLRDSLGAPGAVAVFGYVALVGFMFIGRLIGDRLVDRFGERTVVRAGGLITAAGMGAALAFPSVRRHDRGVRGRGVRSRHPDPGGDASRRPTAGPAPGQRADRADVADADRVLRRTADRRCRGRCDEPAGRAAGGRLSRDWW